MCCPCGCEQRPSVEPEVTPEIVQVVRDIQYIMKGLGLEAVSRGIEKAVSVYNAAYYCPDEEEN